MELIARLLELNDLQQKVGSCDGWKILSGVRDEYMQNIKEKSIRDWEKNKDPRRRGEPFTAWLISE